MTGETFESVPIQLEGNRIDFESIRGKMIFDEPQQTRNRTSTIIARANPADNRDTLEVWLNEQMKYNPIALIVFGGTAPILFLDNRLLTHAA